MALIGDAESRSVGWNLVLFAVLLILCGAPLCWAAENAGQALPPPVPLYSANVTKTSIVGAGMMVISTKDSMDTVLGWYGANLKDRMADVAVAPGHHHYLTRSGAGVDVVAEGSGAKAETRITLFWKSGIGATAKAQPPEDAGQEASAQAKNDQPATVPPKVANADPVAPIEPVSFGQLDLPRVAAETAAIVQPELKLAAIEPIALTPPTIEQAKNHQSATVPPKVANADPVTPIEPVSFMPLDLPRVAVEPAMIAQPELKLAAIEPIEPPPPAIEPVSFEQLDLPRVVAEPAVMAQPALMLAAIEPIVLAPPAIERAKKPEAEKPGEMAEARSPSAEPEGLTLFRAGQYAEALLAWQHAAAAGNVTAALSLGMMYDGGHGVPQNYSQALSWYQLAAEQGSPAGLYNAGVLYDTGLGVPQDTRQAAVFYEKAAARGSARAAFNLALLYERGDGVYPDRGRARKYFSQAERLGVQAARRHLGKSRWQTASDADDDQSFNTVHMIDDETPVGGSRNAAVAADRIRRMADEKDPAAEYDLAYCYEKGIGVEIDLKEAYSLYYQVAVGTTDSRLKMVATAAANVVKAHLAASRTSLAVTR